MQSKPISEANCAYSSGLDPPFKKVKFDIIFNSENRILGIYSRFVLLGRFYL